MRYAQGQKHIKKGARDPWQMDLTSAHISEFIVVRKNRNLILQTVSAYVQDTSAFQILNYT